VNFGVNIVLLLGKGFALLSSSSVSLVASFVDAFLDFISTLIIFLSSVAMGRKGDRHKYPAGKKRFEPLGVLVFSVTMIASFVQASRY
jgi:divalent metal cation (Fe/Co/Zn/Cd) transporter